MAHPSDSVLPSAEQRKSSVTPRAVLHALIRRPLPITAVVILAAAVGASVWFLLPLPKMTVAALFHISAQTPSILTPTSESNITFTSYRQSQAALVKQRRTLTRVLNQPEVRSLEMVRSQPDQIAWLEKAIKVESRQNSELMTVTIEGDNAEELLILMRAISKAVMEGVDERDNGVRRRRLAKLEETNRIYAAEMKRFREKIDDLARVLGSQDGQTLALMDAIRKEDLRTAIREVTAAQDAWNLADLDLKQLDSQSPDGVSPNKNTGIILPWNLGIVPMAGRAPTEIEIEAELQRDPNLRELEALVARARQSLSNTKALLKDGLRTTPVIEAENALAEAEQKRDKYRAEIRQAIVIALRQRSANEEQGRIVQLQNAKQMLARKEKLARAKVDDLKKEIKKANDNLIDLENLKAQISQTEKLSSSLSEEVARLKVELGAPLRVSLAEEEPFLMAGIEGNRRLKYTLLSTVVILALGIGGVVIQEIRNRRVTHTDEVTTELGLRLVGAVPSTAGSDPASNPATHPVFVEAIDTTRTMLLSGIEAGSDMRVLVVTSAVSGEGKTSLAGHLAISLSRAGYRTLLVDGDLRAPSVHEVFGLMPGPGLCELLREEAETSAAIQITRIPSLSVLPAGQWTLSTRQALVADRWRELKDQLKAEYDFVVVDTSPLLLVSDALLLAREADGVVVSVLMGISQISHVTEAVNRLRTVGARLTGIIANGVRAAAHEYTYGYSNRTKKITPILPVAESSTESS